MSTPLAGSEAGTCLHCGLAVEGADYCCRGCELAAAIIRDAGLERYYAEREAPAPRPGGATGRWVGVPSTRLDDGSERARLQVDGLVCGSCVWVTERVLAQTPGVIEARISYADGRAELRWDPEQTDLEQLAGRVAALGYQPRPLSEPAGPDRSLLARLGVAIFSAANVMMLSVGLYLGWFSGMHERYAALFRWVGLVLATPSALWCAEPFFRRAWAGLRRGVLHMDLPVSLGVALLYGHGLIATLQGREGYLDSLTMLVALLLTGRVLEQRGRRRAAEAAQSLAARTPSSARRLVGGSGAVETVASEALAVGDRLLLAAGEEAAADGRVLRGSGALRQALLTGESEPVPVGPGDRVVAGAVLDAGGLEFVVEAAGAGTLLARMAEGLAEAQARPPSPELADRIAPWFTGVVLGLAGLGAAGWYIAAGPGPALEVAIAVMVVACPCALALSSPLAVAAGLGAAARRGLLLRGGDSLRRLARIDRVALDKTGTLTGGVPEVIEADDETLRVAAGLERSSIHPIARAIVAEAGRRGLPIPAGTRVLEVPGEGMRGVVDGVSYTLRRGAPGEVLLSGGGRQRRIRLADTLRPEAARAIAELEATGLRPVLLTGDHPDVAERIATQAGLERAEAGLSPEEKAARIEALGERVLFVGDGLNDGPALARAYAGIAMGGGAASSVLVADGVITAEDLKPLVAGIRAARAAERAVRSNLRRSLIYNTLAVSAALAGLINPLVAAVLMPLSSLMVVWGSSRIERDVARGVG